MPRRTQGSGQDARGPFLLRVPGQGKASLGLHLSERCHSRAAFAAHVWKWGGFVDI